MVYLTGVVVTVRESGVTVNVAEGEVDAISSFALTMIHSGCVNVCGRGIG